jgi:hypothetical protein
MTGLRHSEFIRSIIKKVTDDECYGRVKIKHSSNTGVTVKVPEWTLALF